MWRTHIGESFTTEIELQLTGIHRTCEYYEYNEKSVVDYAKEG